MCVFAKGKVWLECDKVHKINRNANDYYGTFITFIMGGEMCNLCYKLSRQEVREFILCLDDVSSSYLSILRPNFVFYCFTWFG